MNERILILSWGYWAWHNTAAKNIQNYCNENNINSVFIDIIDFWNSKISKITKKIYEEKMELYPNIWSLIFKISNNNFSNNIINLINQKLQNNFDELIKSYCPNKVIVTHPFWLWLINQKNKKFSVWVVITDAIKIHSMWINNSEIVDKYYFIDDGSKELFKDKFWIDNNKLVTSFFPIQSKYFNNKDNINNKYIYLLLTSLTKDFCEKLCENISDQNIELNIIKWRNQKLFDYLKDKFVNAKNINFIDFINIKENLDKIDIMIAKPGWALITECISSDIPMIIPNFMAWQEEWNLILLEQNWIWAFENNPQKVIVKLKENNFKNYISNFKNIKKENSCEIILNNL